MKMIGMKKGQSMVEFALILPLLILMLIVLFDLGRAVLVYSTLNNAVREGTRYAVVRQGGGNVDDIKGQIRSYYFNMKDVYDNSIITITLAGTPTDPKRRIQISYLFTPITPLVTLITGPITINVRSEMFITPFAK